MASPVSGALEVERKYDVDAGHVLPDLAQVPGVAQVGEPVTHSLEATYYDTDDQRLAAARITLRHRRGGSDDGWHLKLPHGTDREELTTDAPAGEVPPELASLVRSRSRGKPLVPAARLSTTRVVHPLLDDAGRCLAEVVDDTVTGHRTADGSTQRWREWEVELHAGEDDLLDAVEVLLQGVGARTALVGSKAGRVLGGAGAAEQWWAPTDDQDHQDHQDAQATAGAAVRAHLAEQVEQVLARDPAARRDLPDGVHKLRVATRRLRTALWTFRPVLDRAVTDPVRVELRWLGRVLGQVRDTEVVHARLTALVAAEPPELVLGRVQDQLDTEMRRRHDDAHRRLLEELDGERYTALLDRLVQLVEDPPLRPEAQQDAAAALAPAMRRAWRRLAEGLDRAAAEPPGPRQDERLHEVRKDAKRARYAAESLVPVFGRPAKRTAKALQRLQERLGEVQDGVATREVLRALGARGHLAGRNGFTFGRLHALEQARAEAVHDGWREVEQDLRRRKLRRWFGG